MLRLRVVLLLTVLAWSSRTLHATAVGYDIGYAVQETASVCDISPNRNLIQAPLFKPYNRANQQWWDNLVEEAAFSNVAYINLNFRGDGACTADSPPAGGEPTSYATNLVNALNARGYSPILKVAMFDDTGAYPAHYSACHGQWVFDFSDHSLWQTYFWDTKWKRFFDNVPDANRMKVNGRPLVFMWGVQTGLGFINQKGNLAPLITWLRSMCQTTYGFDPFIIVDQTWMQIDGTAVRPVVDGVEAWFQVNGGPAWSTYTLTGGHSGTFTTGAVNPGFFSSDSSNYLFTDRKGGATLQNALASVANANLIFIEGLNDSEENAGTYRGSTITYPNCADPIPPPANQAWTYPNQYLNLVREFTAPYAKYVVFEAEACDSYSTFSTAASSIYRRASTLDIAYVDSANSQWAVRMKTGDWLQFQSFQLGASTNYHTGIHYSSAAGGSAELQIDGITVISFTLAATGSLSTYRQYTPPPAFTIGAGRHNIRLKVDSGDIRIDSWILNGF